MPDCAAGARSFPTTPPRRRRPRARAAWFLSPGGADRHPPDPRDRGDAEGESVSQSTRKKRVPKRVSDSRATTSGSPALAPHPSTTPRWCSASPACSAADRRRRRSRCRCRPKPIRREPAAGSPRATRAVRSCTRERPPSRTHAAGANCASSRWRLSPASKQPRRGAGSTAPGPPRSTRWLYGAGDRP